MAHNEEYIHQRYVAIHQFPTKTASCFCWPFLKRNPTQKERTQGHLRMKPFAWMSGKGVPIPKLLLAPQSQLINLGQRLAPRLNHSLNHAPLDSCSKGRDLLLNLMFSSPARSGKVRWLMGGHSLNCPKDRPTNTQFFWDLDKYLRPSN